MKFVSILVFFLCFSIISFSQSEKEINNDIHFWTSINSTIRISNHWGLMSDFHIRKSDFIRKSNFYFLRVGGVYWLNDKVSFASGVAALWLATPLEEEYQYALEKRIYQQVLWRSVIGNTRFLQRVRNEQRWHEVLNPDGTVNRVRFSNRVRFLFSATFKVFENEKMPKLVVADEILFHFGKEIIYNTFDQNRLFLGINQRINKNLIFDFGYMPIIQQNYSGYQYNLNHTMRLFFYYSPDFRKGKKKKILHYPVSGNE